MAKLIPTTTKTVGSFAVLFVQPLPLRVVCIRRLSKLVHVAADAISIKNMENGVQACCLLWEALAC
jgi:hypothetical protein